MLKELSQLPDSCIYGLINKSEKKIYLGFTRNLITALNRIIKEVKYSNHVLKEDFDKLELTIIETVPESLLRTKYQFWFNEYSNMGYLHYRRFKAIGYKLRIEVLTDLLRPIGGLPRIYVSLQCGRFKRVTVGVFSSVDECDSFVNQFYPNKYNINNIVYSNNSLTNEFINYVK